MKKRTIALLMAVVMLFGMTVAGTLAWLQAESETVTNTFTVGDINIKLDEADVNLNILDGEGNVIGVKYTEFVDEENNEVATVEKANRVQENEYKLIPGSEYFKDPMVTVEAGSEPCYVYITVIESNNDNDIIEWELADCWVNVKDNVYVYADADDVPVVVDAMDALVDDIYIIAGNEIAISEDLTKTEIEALDGVAVDGSAAPDEVNARPKLVFNAFAVQSANMTDAVAAWNATFGA